MDQIRQLDFSENKVASMSDAEIDRLPESFAIEFITALTIQLSAMGASLRQGGLINNDENAVYYEGRLSDGTIIRLEARKGNNYQAPKDIVLEIRERLRKAQEGK